ncbi:MAG: ABC transporter ATP-binding protein [Methanosarcina thermophila]|mgnify:FL=1|uniref:Molybdate/tungstate import ATP-binding protein WtpC n=3 Tax=Methanosarcina thermophila TaxID=2210 RepID=A0A1I6ZIQ9_METTE|nr:ABC transporter ATP-binding protein [Methanosarcina thermophila]ALK04900.1 MAG: nitrate ABC transporter ATP-binding protein [Methanosarcina sp. 795]AKB13618.1 ABC-type nitrate/sulfonate/bicarbonate transport system, ATPase component [Methanosarcina thermophila TM-1]AKB15744.1 ABC-type nitrate/sulfonate/bicarbonate transport system, ATPase component [Methanosarcina thermophila CHTI-55]NLU58042.1 ABC transporter ATP-binding protein [Methanosarcina thermophila]SFT62503.1 NitT/TauT family trans
MGRVSIKNVSRIFTKKEGNGVTEALRDVSFDVEDGEFICILGPSGCGKTTLLRIIAGLETQTSGEITLNGVPITGPDPKRGMVFQQYSLFPWRTVIDNVTFGLEMQGISKAEARKHAEKYIDLVGLEQFKNSYPYELSGGMQQRAAIARALANEPEVLLMDEPFGALDAQTRNILQDELLKIWEQKHITCIFVTHSVDEAVVLSDRILVMTTRPGRIKEIVPVDLPRPRRRTSPEVNSLRDRVLKLLEEERFKR